MTYRTHHNLPAHGAPAVGALKGRMLLRSIIGVSLALLVLTTISPAAEPPDAPSSVSRMDADMIEVPAPVVTQTVAAPRPIDSKFVSLALISTGSTFADSYTTLFARQNWLAGKKGVCNVETQSAYLYGTHPTVARAYAVASVKSVGSVVAAYYLRKHHSKFWSLPLVANSIVSLQGVAQNMATCN